MRHGIVSVLAVVLIQGWAEAQMPYPAPPTYPMAGYPMPTGIPGAYGMPSPYGLPGAYAPMPYAPAPMPPGPMPPPMIYGPLQRGGPVFTPPVPGQVAPDLGPRQEVTSNNDNAPRRQGLSGLLSKRQQAPPKDEAPGVEPLPGMPLWSDDPDVGTHGLPPPPLPPDRGPSGPCYYGKAEYLYFWTTRQRVPVLLTAQPAAGGAEVPLLGASGRLDFDNGERQGFRITQGVWIDAQQTFGLDGSFLMFGDRSPDSHTFSDGSVILRRPFINGVTGLPDSLVIAEPGRPGRFDVGTISRMYTGDVNFRWELLRAPWFHFDALLGFRFFRLEDEVTMQSFTEVLNVTFNDRFSTENTFYGGQLGFETEIHHGPLFLDFWGKLALGNNHERIAIAGETINNMGGVVTVSSGGLFAQPSNIATRDHNEFAILPELGVNVGWKVLEHLRLTVGYSVLYLSRTARAGDFIDPVIDRSQATAVPAFQFRSTGYFAHALSAGIEFRY